MGRVTRATPLLLSASNNISTSNIKSSRLSTLQSINDSLRKDDHFAQRITSLLQHNNWQLLMASSDIPRKLNPEIIQGVFQNIQVSRNLHPLRCAVILEYLLSQRETTSCVGKGLSVVARTLFLKELNTSSLYFSSDYPFKAPKVKFETMCFHPNVDIFGNICLDILKDKWSSTYDVRTILLSIQSLLGEPNNDSPLQNQAAALWSNQIVQVKRSLATLVSIADFTGSLANVMASTRSPIGLCQIQAD